MNTNDWDLIPCTKAKNGDYVYFLIKGSYSKQACAGTVRGVGTSSRIPFGKPKAIIMLETNGKIQSHKVKGNVWRKKT